MSVKAELERLMRIVDEQERAERDPVALLVGMLREQTATMERMHRSALELADRQADRAMALVDTEARKVEGRLRRGNVPVGGASQEAYHQSTTGAAPVASPGGPTQDELPLEQVPREEILGAADGFYRGAGGGLVPMDAE